ncbi:hypothetical protein KC573_01270 [candidate division WWE3 bacterium]|uniref:Uncharacterized protein n=1 Tax=candidate division WWE3 bacterium TaxID=2053526 RepID=A0A955LVS1_UNCKA|nr:hypothetical protein [candidate division WWE3 bacterium]
MNDTSLWEQLPYGMPPAVKREFERNDDADLQHHLLQDSVLQFWTDYYIAEKKVFCFEYMGEKIPVNLSDDGILYFAVKSGKNYLLFCLHLDSFKPFRHSTMCFLNCLSRLSKIKNLQPFKRLHTGDLTEVKNYLKGLSQMKMRTSF